MEHFVASPNMRTDYYINPCIISTDYIMRTREDDTKSMFSLANVSSIFSVGPEGVSVGYCLLGSVGF